MAAPLAYTQDSEPIGAFLFATDLIDITRKRLHFFRSIDESEDVETEPAVLFPPLQNLAFDYPLMVYKGFAPDNRELVMVNLADEESPQLIIHLNTL